MRPDGSHTEKPTWRTIRDTFDDLYLVSIEEASEVIHEALKGLNTLRRQILQLLQVPIKVYTTLRDQWWVVATE
jgi:hypothetical protein